MRKKIKAILKFVGEIILDAAVIFGVFFLLKTYVIAPFEVFGPSMCNSFNYFNGKCNHSYGEYIIINKIGYVFENPQRGDIVVFKPPNENEFYIKRIIGLPGDTIYIKNGNIYLNDVMLNEPYLNTESENNTGTFGLKRTEFTVPKNEYFVAGDNRPLSTDSRTCFKDPISNGCSDPNNAFVPKKNIEGRAWVVLWPIGKIKFIPRFNYGL